MNERIKELIMAAGFPKFDKMYVVSDGEELEKFAELIIKECADWIDEQDESRCPWSRDLIRHFGVKE